MSNAKNRSTNKVLESGLPRNGLGLKVVNWVRKLVQGNPPIRIALGRTWYSLKVLVAGAPVTDAEAKARAKIPHEPQPMESGRIPHR